MIKFLNPQQTLTYRDQFVAIYRQAFRSFPYNKREDEVIDFDQSLPAHIRKTDFRIVVAFETQTEAIRGFAYGYASTPTDLFNRELAKITQPDLISTWLSNSFRVVEMAIKPEIQGQGIGGALHNQLLQGLPYKKAILATMAAETNAYQMYRKRGWQILRDEIVFPGVPRPYRVMGLDLSTLSTDTTSSQFKGN